jgi:hypothetical protein
VINRLDKLLGGVFLAAGAGAGVAAAGPPALAPLGVLSALWGWLEQRDEALRLLRSAVDAVAGKLDGTSACERRQLIAAAHTTIVVAAFFEALRDLSGAATFAKLQNVGAKKEQAAVGRLRRHGESLYDFLRDAEIPAPSPARGFEENCHLLRTRIAKMATDMQAILDDIGIVLPDAVSRGTSVDWSAVQNLAAERYRSRYLEVAATVPEFLVWALLGEHAATRAAVATLSTDVAAALGGSREALGGLAALLAAGASQPCAVLPSTEPAPRLVLARANGGVLDETILPEDTRTYGPTITFPRVRDIYINPRYRLAPDGAAAVGDLRSGDELWWLDQPARDEFDLMLAGYMTAPDAVRAPMLLLGHPGAGKSLLMKVLAARLPSADYTVVRVPLRRVDCDVPLVSQVQQALNLATNHRVEWWQLAEQSKGSVRVVLLDGLDELLQASQHDRSGYLHEVTEFQRVEAEQERPVVVIVTSRTVVADRVSIPAGTTLVKVDPFSEDDIASWLARWHRANTAAIAAGVVRELPLSTALRQPELAAQPLLLLMLAVYAADPALPSLDGEISTARLYERLLEGFTRREASKGLHPGAGGDELGRRTQDHLERLAVAALAMFNRGRQDIDEESLGLDLSVLDPGLMARSRPAEAGQRIIGEFFFVHAPEATVMTGPEISATGHAARTAWHEESRRAYEFLHATFAEFLVARRVADEVTDLSERVFAGRRGPAAPDDELLFALLSHQALAARRAALDFAREILTELPCKQQGAVREVLEMLLGDHRSRHSSGRYAAYQPVPLDHVRQLACYSANLTALRAALEPGGGQILLARLLRAPDDSSAMQQWRSTVRLWQSGLDADAFQAMLGTVKLDGDPPAVTYGPRATAQSRAATEIALCRLTADTEMESRLRYGTAITDRYTYGFDGDSWYDRTASMLIPMIIGHNPSFAAEAPPPGTPDDEIAAIADLISCCLRSSLAKPAHDHELVQLLFSLPGLPEVDTLAMASAVMTNPELPAHIPELQNSRLFGDYAGIVQKVRSYILPRDTDLHAPSTETAVALRDLLKSAHRSSKVARLPAYDSILGAGWGQSSSQERG